MSQQLGAKLYEFDIKRARLVRYFLCFYKTLFVVYRDKPKVIFVQNPSMILALLMIWVGRLFGKFIVVDAHNAGIMPFRGPRKIVNALARYIICKADLTIVTNSTLADYVQNTGGVAFVLPDPIPNMTAPTVNSSLAGSYNVLFICTYADDEPYLEVIKAAASLPPEVVIYISGNPGNRQSNLEQLKGDNVILTGFLPEGEFSRLLFSADLIVDLTTREDCLVCGAYEAVAAEKTLLLSDTQALRSYFSPGALYTDNSASDITEKIMTAIRDKQKLEEKMIILKQMKLKEWAELKSQLEDKLILAAVCA